MHVYLIAAIIIRLTVVKACVFMENWRAKNEKITSIIIFVSDPSGSFGDRVVCISMEYMQE